jgi:hypothetical protein
MVGIDEKPLLRKENPRAGPHDGKPCGVGLSLKLASLPEP